MNSYGRGLGFVLCSSLLMGIFSGLVPLIWNWYYSEIFEASYYLIYAKNGAIAGLIYSSVTLGIARLVGSVKIPVNMLIGLVPGLLFSFAMLFVGCGMSLVSFLILLVAPLILYTVWITWFVPTLLVSKNSPRP